MPEHNALPKITDLKSLIEWCESVAENIKVADDLIIKLPIEEYRRIHSIARGEHAWEHEDFEVPVMVGSTHPTTFYVKFQKNYDATRRKLDKCVCDINTLMRDGCRCGGFEREKNAQAGTTNPSDFGMLAMSVNILLMGPENRLSGWSGASPSKEEWIDAIESLMNKIANKGGSYGN